MRGQHDGEDLDHRVLRALQRNGRASVQEIARTLGLPRGTVASRLRHLLDAGLIRVVAAVDPHFLGEHVIAHVSVLAAGPAGPIAAALTALQDTVLVTCCGGEPAVVCEVRTSSMRLLNHTLAHIRTLPAVTAIKTQVYTELLTGLFISSWDGVSGIDGIDESLINQLRHNGRATYRQLGDAVHLSAPAARARVGRLLSAGIIRISAVEERGAGGRQLSMGVGLCLRGDGDEVAQQLVRGDSVEFAARCVGQYDIVATLVGSTPSELLTQLDALRSSPEVRSVTTWQHLHLAKENYAGRSLGRPASAVDNFNM